MPSIYCSVNNCHYWKEGNVCDADQIMVTSDVVADAALESLDAPEHEEFHQTPAESCMDTCCKTFVERGSGAEGLDGVLRQ